MAIVCSNITNGIVVTRDRATKLFEKFCEKALTANNNPMVVEVLKQMRKASQQINAIDIMKSRGSILLSLTEVSNPGLEAFKTNDGDLTVLWSGGYKTK